MQAAPTPYETTLGALGVALAAGVPTVLWGGPGEGKTSAVTQAAAALGLHLEVVLASVREPTDFAGLPVVDGGAVRLAPPDWARRLVQADERGLVPAVFFDEVNTAPPAVQAALLRVCVDRVVGDLALPASTVVLAAANPPEIAADGWDLAPPLANRFCHLSWRLPAAVVAEGLLGAWPVVPVPVLPPELPLAAARAAVAGYLRARPDDVSVVPRDATAAGRAFPTPRTWEMAARLLAVCEAAGAHEAVRRAVVAGVVGDAAALQLLTWLDALDLPDPEDLLADPSSFVLPERGDRAFSVLASVVAAALSRPTAERWQAAVRVVAVSVEQGRADVGAAAVTALLRQRPEGVALPPEIKGFAPLLVRAGLLAP